MNPNSTTPEETPLQVAEKAQAAIAAVSPKIPAITGTRFPSTNIRLSTALCALGFAIRDDAEPVMRTAEMFFKRRTDCANCRAGRKHDHVDVTFYHLQEPLPDSPVLLTFPKIVAIDVEAWWRYPGKSSIAGFDDALNAMRRVLEVREWILAIVFGSRQIVNAHFTSNAVITTSLRFASVIRACGFDLLAFEKMPGRGNDRFVFPARAARVIELVSKCHDAVDDKSREEIGRVSGRPGIYPDRRDDGRDLCIDWMLWALEYHGRLIRKVKAAAPMVEIRENSTSKDFGDRVCRVHSQMDRTLKREFMSHF